MKIFVSWDFLIGIGMLGLLGFTLWGVPRLAYNMSPLCSVWVDDELVYNGKCQLVRITPIGEYGYTKTVLISKNMYLIRKANKYVSDNVKVKEFVENERSFNNIHR